MKKQNSNIYELPEWKNPRAYFGHSPDGDFIIYAIQRNSSAMDLSNWECIQEYLYRKSYPAQALSGAANFEKNKNFQKNISQK